MARIDYWQYLVDNKGRPLEDAEVRVYLAGTLTEATIYLNSAFGSFTTSSVADLKTDKNGFVQFWVGDEFETEGGYESTQAFKVVWQNTVDSVEEEIDDLYLFAPVVPLDTSDSIQGVPSNKDANKVISNKQGYKWDTHTDSIVPSASPHDLEPVVLFNLDDRQNKVISNKLGYQMYTMAQTASVTPMDISAARFHREIVPSLSVSGSTYYTDVIHNFNNYYPIVRVSKINNNHRIEAKRVQSINPNTVRVWLEENISVYVVVYG